VIISGFRDRGMWPFDREKILLLAEKEWLGRTPIKQSARSVEIVEEAQQILSDLFEKKRNTPRAGIRKV
jgi:hypothetical protein